MALLRVLLIIILAVGNWGTVVLAGDLPPLDFEQGAQGEVPRGWGGGPPGTVFADSLVTHGGRWAGRIARTSDSPRNFSAMTAVIPDRKQGKSITLSGYLKIQDVENYCGLWLRLDGEAGNVGFDNMSRRELKGTQDWTQYTITLPFSPETQKVVFGALLSGSGQVWVDDLQLLVDGKPFAEADDLVVEKTVLDMDTEFDQGSGFDPGPLTEMQIRNLALLGKVWGFVKYHHPDVTGGTRHWDYDLFRALPGLLEAADEKEAAGEILTWLGMLEEPSPCDPCATLGDDLAALPRLAWLEDEQLLGRTLSRRLQDIYRNRHTGGSQFYVDQIFNVGNPQFHHEKAYGWDQLPDPGFRLLALFRYWNIIEYWFPNRDIIDRDWDEVLVDYLPRVLAADSYPDYTLAMLQLIAEVRDGHAQLYRAEEFRPPEGPCRVPVAVRFLEGQAVVTGFFNETHQKTSALQIGDVIRKIDGTAVQDLVRQWESYYPASNPDHRLLSMARNLTRGPWGPVTLEIQRIDQILDLKIDRVAADRADLSVGRTHDLPGETFRLLGDEVGYLKLSSVKLNLVGEYLKQARDTRGLIIDIRNYPSEFVVFALGGRLIAESTPFVCFTKGDLANPGSFAWRPQLFLSPIPPRYQGQIIILVDETSMSQAEYTAMALRAAPGALVVGSTTAGADGNISKITLPGGLTTHISGIGVFGPDRSPTQRVGIVPDIEVRPTIAGILDHRDEVLEEALRQILKEDAEGQELKSWYR